MNGNLGLVPQPFRSDKCVEIAGQKRCLKKNYAGIPYGRGASEQRKRHFRDHRFYEEQKSRADKHRDGEGDQQHKDSHCSIVVVSGINHGSSIANDDQSRTHSDVGVLALVIAAISGMNRKENKFSLLHNCPFRADD